jgi:hypothetical protein
MPSAAYNQRLGIFYAAAIVFLRFFSVGFSALGQNAKGLYGALYGQSELRHNELLVIEID